MPTCYSFGRRGPTFLIIAAVFLLSLISLHNRVGPRQAPPTITAVFAYPARCPTTPPNPPYNRTSIDGSFSWRDIPEKYPVEQLRELPSSWSKSSLPKIQFDFQPPTKEAEAIRVQRQKKVKATFQRAWHSYERYAWKQDELKPISGGSKNTFGGWGATLVDNLDTLIIMEMYEEFDRAVNALLDIDFNPESSSQSTINIFETTIRYLGGLLAAYDLTGCGDTRLLDKAIQIGDMIYASFDTPNRMPVTRWNPHKAAGSEAQSAASNGIIAEMASSSLELTRLSQLTGDMRYFDAVARITDVLDEQQSRTHIPGLWPVGINVQKPDLTKGSSFSLGGMADSAYEYLPKTYQLLAATGDKELSAQYKQMYENALDTAAEHLLFRPMTHDHADILIATTAQSSSAPPTSPNRGSGSSNSKLTAGPGSDLTDTKSPFTDAGGKNPLTDHGDNPADTTENTDMSIDWSAPESNIISPATSSSSAPVTKNNQGEHLACFIGGTYALGARLFGNDRHLSLAKKLTDGCVWLYHNSPNGIMPETFTLPSCPSLNECQYDSKQDGGMGVFASVKDKRYILRPEAIESVFYMYRVTGEERMRDVGWEMFQAIDSASQTEYGNAAIRDVMVPEPDREDSMESFWMAETLKYFYLLYSEPGVVSLDEFVLNTEAHPFRLPL